MQHVFYSADSALPHNLRVIAAANAAVIDQ